MKKLAFLFTAIVAVSFASCGNKAQQAEETATDSVAVEAEAQAECVCDSACTDSTACDSACAATECAEAPAAE